MTALVWALASGIGLVLGGSLSQFASWRWTWYIILPISALAFLVLLAVLDVHESRTPFLPGIKQWTGPAASP